MRLQQAGNMQRYVNTFFVCFGVYGRMNTRVEPDVFTFIRTKTFSFSQSGHTHVHPNTFKVVRYRDIWSIVAAALVNDLSKRVCLQIQIKYVKLFATSPSFILYYSLRNRENLSKICGISIQERHKMGALTINNRQDTKY